MTWSTLRFSLSAKYHKIIRDFVVNRQLLGSRVICSGYKAVIITKSSIYLTRHLKTLKSKSFAICGTLYLWNLLNNFKTMIIL